MSRLFCGGIDFLKVTNKNIVPDKITTALSDRVGVWCDSGEGGLSLNKSALAERDLICPVVLAFLVKRCCGERKLSSNTQVYSVIYDSGWVSLQHLLLSRNPSSPPVSQSTLGLSTWRHPTPFILHPSPYTLHPTPYTLQPFTLHPTPYTLQGMPTTPLQVQKGLVT